MTPIDPSAGGGRAQGAGCPGTRNSALHSRAARGSLRPLCGTSAKARPGRVSRLLSSLAWSWPSSWPGCGARRQHGLDGCHPSREAARKSTRRSEGLRAGGSLSDHDGLRRVPDLPHDDCARADGRREHAHPQGKLQRRRCRDRLARADSSFLLQRERRHCRQHVVTNGYEPSSARARVRSLMSVSPARFAPAEERRRYS